MILPLKALNYIIAKDSTLQIDIINMSLGAENYDSQADCDANNAAYKTAFATLRSLGISIFISTGNDFDTEGVGAPACVTGAIAVGSTNDANAVFCSDDVYAGVTCYSNATETQGAGELIDLLAPGCSILSEYIGGGYEELCGTSMATPMAAGVAALIKSARPGLKPNKLENLLENSGDLTYDARLDQYYPAVNAFYAYGSLIIGAPTGLFIQATDAITPSITLTWIGVTGATDYIVERSNNGGKFVAIDAGISTATTFTDSALACGEVAYRVRASNGPATGNASNVVDYPGFATCPDAPTGLTWEFVAPDDFKLDWSDNSTGETSFEIQRSIDGGVTFTTAFSTGANVETYTDSSPATCTEYAYRIVAIVTGGDFPRASNPSNTVYAGCPPANDLFANAETLTVAGDVETAVRYAQVQAGDYVHPCRFDGAGTGGNTVWYTFTPAENGWVNISTEDASYDTIISIVTGTPGAFSPVACSEDIDADNGIYQSEIYYAPVSSGTTYYVQVSSYPLFGVSSAATLDISYTFTNALPVPANDDFANAEAISGESYSDTEPNANLATSAINDPILSCRYNTPGAGDASMWYSYQPTMFGHATISTEGSSGTYYDTTVGIYTGTPGAFTEIACAEDISEDDLNTVLVNVPMYVGTTYYIYVARYTAPTESASGELVMNFTFDSNLLRNANFDGATVGGVPSNWVRAGTTSANDKNKCVNNTQTLTAPCSIVFKGSPGENTTFAQALNATRLNTIGLYPVADAQFIGRINTLGLNASGVLTVKIKYTDGTPKTKVNVPFGASPTFAQTETLAFVESGAVKSVALIVKSNAASGKSYADNAELLYDTSTLRADRGGSVLPPPAAPDGFRGNN